MECLILWTILSVHSLMSIQISLYHLDLFAIIPTIKNLIVYFILYWLHKQCRKPSKQIIAQMITPIKGVAVSKEAELYLVGYFVVNDLYTASWYDKIADNLSSITDNTIAYNRKQPMLFENDLYGLAYASVCNTYIVTKQVTLVEDTKTRSGKCRTLDCIAVYLLKGPSADVSHQYFHGKPTFFTSENWQTITNAKETVTSDSFYYEFKQITIEDSVFECDTKLPTELCDAFYSAFSTKEVTTITVPATAVVKTLKDSDLVIPEVLTQFIPVCGYPRLEKMLATEFGNILNVNIPINLVLQRLACFYINLQAELSHKTFYVILTDVKKTHPAFLEYIRLYLGINPLEPMSRLWPYKTLLNHIDEHLGVSRDEIALDAQFNLSDNLVKALTKKSLKIPTIPPPIVENEKPSQDPPKSVKTVEPLCATEANSSTADPTVSKTAVTEEKESQESPKKSQTPQDKLTYKFISTKQDPKLSQDLLKSNAVLFDLNQKGCTYPPTDFHIVGKDELKDLGSRMNRIKTERVGKWHSTSGKKLSECKHGKNKLIVLNLSPVIKTLSTARTIVYQLSVLRYVYIYTILRTPQNLESLSEYYSSQKITPAVSNRLKDTDDTSSTASDSDSNNVSPLGDKTVNSSSSKPDDDETIAISQKVIDYAKHFYPTSCPLVSKSTTDLLTSVSEQLILINQDHTPEIIVDAIPFSTDKETTTIVIPSTLLDNCPPFPNPTDSDEFKYIVNEKHVSMEEHLFDSQLTTLLDLGEYGYYNLHLLPAFKKGATKKDLEILLTLLLKQARHTTLHNRLFTQEATVEHANSDEMLTASKELGKITADLFSHTNKLNNPVLTSTDGPIPRKATYAQIASNPQRNPLNNNNLNNNISIIEEPDALELPNVPSPHDGGP